MGPFGRTHFDPKDYSGAFSNLVLMPDLLDNMDTSSLFILLAGIYIPLNSYVSVNFSGLHFHGSTPPLVPEGTDIKGWEAKLNSVLYPQSTTLEGGALYPLVGSLDKKGILHTAPEMRHPE